MRQVFQLKKVIVSTYNNLGDSPMTIGTAIKERILELCSERDITINKLSNMSGITQSTINNITSGRNNSATVATVKKSAMV